MHDLSLRVPGEERKNGHSKLRWTILVCLLVLTAIIVGLASPAAQARKASEACAGGAGCVSSGGSSGGGSSGGNDAPTARDDRYDTKEDGKLTVKAPGVLRNDAGNRLSAARVSTPRHGSLALERNGSFVYTPDENFNGTDSFAYEARNGKSDRATVRIAVAPVNDAPSFLKGTSQAVAEDAGAQSIARWASGISAGPANESDQRVSFVLSSDNNTLFSRQPTISPDGTLTFTPKAEESGEATVSVKLRDSGDAAAPNDNESDTKTFKISVREVNDAPTVTATNDGPVDEGGSAKITASATDPDTPASSFSYQFDCNGDGDYADAGDKGPQPGKTAGCSFPESGDRTVNVRVKDGSGGVDTGSTRVRVANVAPTADFGNGGPADEGSPATVSFTNQNDASIIDLNALFRYEYRCDGSAFPAAPNYATASTDDSTTCTFGNDGSYTVRARIIDEDGGARVYTTNVTVQNVKPSISLTGPSTANEGEKKNYSFTVTDPGSDDTHTATTACGTGQKVSASYDPATRRGDLECEFPDGPSTTDVTATVTDSDGASDTDNQKVTVDTANVAPTVELTGDATADEGQTKTYTYTVTDPGTDPTPTIVEDCGTGVKDDTAAANSFDCTFPDGPDNPTVSVSADDGDDTGSDSIEVIVSNVAPRVTLSGPDAADEGQTKSYTYTVTDPGDDPNPTITTSCGTGATKSNETPGGFDCTFPDGPNNPTVSVSADDGDPSNNTGSDTQAVDVSNLAPTADGQSVTTDEDTAKTITLTGSDPVGAADPLSFKVTSLPNDGTLYEGTGTSAADEIQPSDLPKTLTGDQVTYEPDENSNGSDALNFRVNDGDANSAVATVSIQVNAVNDAPTVGTESSSASYTEGGQAVEISPLLTVGDPDTANLAGATVSITTGRRSGDTLSFATQNGITGNYDSGTGVLTLTGSSSVENYQTALRSVEYSSTSNAPGASRTVSFQVNDGEAANNLSNTATRDVSITETNSPPDITTSSGTTAFLENDPAVAVDDQLTVTDSDSGDLIGATISITGGLASGQDGLSFTDQNGITGSTYDAATGVLTLTGNASVADYETALRSVRYDNTSDTPNTDQRTVSFQVDDGSSVSNLSNTATKDVSVTATNDLPQIDLNGAGTGTGHSATFTEDGSAVSIVDSANLTVTDADDANIDSASVKITNLQNGASESLDADVGTTGITKSYDSSTGVLTLGNSATKAQYRQVLRTVMYNNTSQNPGTTDRNVSFVVNDGDDDSNAATSTVTVNGINDAPTLTTTSGVLTYTENDAATEIDSALTLGDVDSANMSGATVRITSGYASGEDVLSFTNQNGITGSFSGDTLTLSGSSSAANYQTALRTVKYSNTSENPSAAARTVTFRVDDGGAVNNLSNTPTRSIDVIPVNDAPTAANDSFSGAIGNTKLAVGTTVTGEPVVNISGDVLTGDTDVEGNALTARLAAGTNPAGGRVVNMNSDGTFTYVPDDGFTGTDSFDYEVCDNGTTDGASDPKCGSGTIQVSVSNMVWYVKNDASGGGLGRSTDPFDTLPKAQTASGANHTIFVYEGNSSTTGQNAGIALKDGQKLLGQGVDLVIGNTTLVSGNTANRPAIGNSGGDGVSVLANTANGARTGVEIRGLRLSGSTNAVDATSANGANLGLTISDNVVTGAGAEGIDVNLGSTGTGTLAIHDNTVTATGNAVDVRRTAGAARITRFDDNTVSGDTGGDGFYVESVTFDATPGGSFDTVSGGTTAIGASGNGVGAHGVQLTSVSGDLSFDDLDVVASAGNGLYVQGTGHFNGTSGMRLGVTAPAGGGSSTITTTGGAAVNATSVTLDLQLDTVKSANGSSHGLGLGNTSGTFSAGSGSEITNAGAADVLISSSPVAFSYAGTITDDQGRLVEVSHTTASGSGDKTFSGAITDGNDGDGSGILLDNNDAATVDFTGGLTLSTGTNNAFTATNGGTVNVTGANNTIAAAGGMALNVANTTIGSNGLTFTSISANGGANGIVLNNTGTSGGLTITGDGSTANSGGTITQSAAGTAVSLTNASNVQLKLMKLSVTSTSGTGLIATNLSGTNSLEKSVVDFNNTVAAGSYALRLANTSTNATLTLDGTTFQNKQDGTTAVSVSAMGSSVMTVNVRDSNTGDSFESKYTNLFGSGIVMGAGDDAGSTANVHFNVSNTKFVNAPSNGLNNLEMGVGANATLIPNISNNTFDKIGLPLATVGVINLNAFAGGRVGSDAEFGLVFGNTITNVRSGAGPTFAYDPNGTNGYLGMRFAIDNPGVTGINHRLKIANNNISNMARQGILVSAREQATNTNVVITNNQVGTPAAPVGLSNRRGIELEAQETAVLNALVDNNTVYGFGSSGSNAALAVRAGVAGDLGDPTTSTVNATVTNNTLRSTNGSATGGAAFRAETISGNSGTMCLDLRANTLGFTANANTPVFELNNNSGTFRVEGAGTGAVTSGNIASTNNGFGATFLGSVVFNNNANCTQPGF